METKWERYLDFDFNIIKVGEVFDYKRNDNLLLASCDGTIRIFPSEKSIENDNNANNKKGPIVLETKGSSLVALALRSSPFRGKMDVVVGDTEGNVTLFSDGEILGRIKTGSCVSSLESTINGSIIVGGRDGSLSSYQVPGEIEWKDFTPPPLSSFSSSLSQPVSCLLIVNFPDLHGVPTSAIAVSRLGSNFVCFHHVREGKCLATSSFPGAVSCLATLMSVLFVGSTDGFVYLADGFGFKSDYEGKNDNSLSQHSSVMIGHSVSQIEVLEDSGITSEIAGKDFQGTKGLPKSRVFLFCIGHFNGVKVYSSLVDELFSRPESGFRCILTISTENWIHSFSAKRMPNDDENKPFLQSSSDNLDPPITLVVALPRCVRAYRILSLGNQLQMEGNVS